MCLGVPGKVIEIYETDGLKMGKVDFGGVVRETCLAYVPEIEVGEYTVIHVGFAISQLSEEEAQATLEILKELADLEEELGPEPDGADAGMKYIDEYRDADLVRKTAAEIGRTVTRPWTIMEICGGQTHAIMHFRHRPTAAPGDRAGSWSGLPGMCNAVGTDRQSAGHCRAA